MTTRRIAALLVLVYAVQGAITPEPLESGLDLSSLDRSVRPQDDLYRFANGGWLQRTEIPPDRVSYGTFPELTDRTELQLREIIENLEGRTASGTQDPRLLRERHGRAAHRRDRPRDRSSRSFGGSRRSTT